jgi:hypothetical protein
MTKCESSRKKACAKVENFGYYWWNSLNRYGA